VNRRHILTMMGASGAALMCGGFTWPFAEKERRTSLLIAGATSMQPALVSLVTAFAAKNGHIDAVVEGGGSTPGLIAVQRGAIEIAALTRQPTRFEETADTRAFLICKDALAIAVHASVPLKTLSYAAIRQIFQGQVENWRDVGGPDLAIQLVHRSDENSVVFSAALQMLLEQEDVPDKAQRVDSDEAMREMITARRGAIGYLSLKNLTAGLNVLEIGGVAPGRITALSGRYPLTRPYYLATHGPLNDAVSGFLAFVRGAEGQSILEREGLIRVY
jgi:phosphate transport system substrate-binding protein